MSMGEPTGGTDFKPVSPTPVARSVGCKPVNGSGSRAPNLFTGLSRQYHSKVTPVTSNRQPPSALSKTVSSQPSELATVSAMVSPLPMASSSVE